MPDRLEQRLAALAAELEFPPTPDLAPGVLARVAATPRRRALAPARRSLALAAAALALLAGGAAALPPVRDAVGDLLGLEGATVERVPRLPAAPGGLDLGRRVTLADARPKVGFEPLLPHDPELGRPAAAYLRGTAPLAQLTLLYRPGRDLPATRTGGVGLLLTEFRGDLQPDLVEKFIGPETGTRRVRVGSARGFFIAGAHTFAYRDPNGLVRVEERRLAEGTLLWQRGRLLLRLESKLPLRRALEIARTVR